MSYPDWYNPGKMRRRANARVASGLHPLGMDLGPEEKTCGDCAHLWVKNRGRRYFKCGRARHTCGPASDVVKKWRSCSLFAEVRTCPACNRNEVRYTSGLCGVCDAVRKAGGRRLSDVF